MSMRNTKWHVYVQIASLIILALLGIFFSFSTDAVSTTVNPVINISVDEKPKLKYCDITIHQEKF